MAIASDMKEMLSIKMKHRHDAYSDQFTRILLMKLMLVGCFFIGMNWFGDNINCIIPGTNGFDGDYTSEACWINGEQRKIELTTQFPNLLIKLYSLHNTHMI